MEFVIGYGNNLNRFAFKTFKVPLQTPNQVNYFYSVIKQLKMKRVLQILIVMVSLQVSAQTSEKYNSEYENFYRGEELFEKEQFGAARREFRNFLNGQDDPNDPMYIKASYYEAISALELYNEDALALLLAFNQNYPESIYKQTIFYRLGKYYYYKKKWDDALAWFNKVSIQDVPIEERDEFYFKIGYANFKGEHFEPARLAFLEIKDGNSQYAAPALYYYSHIAYRNETYQIALEGFLKLENNESFGKIVPYYIAQIYYLQGKYELVTIYATKLYGDEGKLPEKELNLLIGDAFYRIGKYDEAVPYLEKFNKSSETTRDEDYRLGYAYYKSARYDKAVRMFDQVKKVEDSLGQIAFYHIGECMLKLDNIVSARSAFERAAFIDIDPVVQEDALYNYAILSYKMDLNPYDEAVEAFELYLERYPNSNRKEDVYQYLVNVYMNTNNYTKALASLDNIPNKNIHLKQAYQLIAYNQGVEHFQKNNWNLAIKSFNLVDKYPIDQNLSGMAIYWIADAYFRLNNFDQAIVFYQRFGLQPLTTSPGLKQESLYNLGYCHLEKADQFHKQDKQAQREVELTKSSTSFRSFLDVNPKNAPKKADATMRIGDAFFVLKDNAQAIKFYKEALGLKSGYEDQALYYMAITYGYMDNKLPEKISSLLDIINNYPTSTYLMESIELVARTFFSIGQYDKALQYYNKIIFDYPVSTLYVDAKINVADIHFKQDKYDLAEEEYMAILKTHGQDNSTCSRVAEGLKSLYTETNNVDKIEQLANQYACFEFSVDEKENLYYVPAIEIYFDSTMSDNQRYTQAIPKLENYLNKFPNGRYSTELRDYLANSYYELGNVETAISIYIKALEGPNTTYTEFAAARVSSYLYNNGQYEEAIPYYRRVEQIGSNPERQYNAILGLMRSHYQIENWQNAALYAEKVLANPKTTGDTKLNANYVDAMSNYNLAHYNDAKTPLGWLVNNTTTIYAAEARFALADIAFKQGDFTAAHTGISGLIKMKPKYNYWVAKGLILRARVYMSEDNLFQAEQDLRSIREHYPINDDGVMDEANQLWDELMQLKDAPKTIEEEGERTIEIIENGN